MTTPRDSDSEQNDTPTVLVTVDESQDGPALQPGATIGRYLTIEELGRGGMGIVLRAYDPRLSREVALKLLRTERVGPDGRARLVREAQAMAQLSHPNVVSVYDVDESGDQLVMAMEYVRGVTLKQWVRDADPPGRDWSAIVDAFVQAGKGLAAAHAQGLLHRDFKPANVLVGDNGRVRVTDFGLARIEGPSSHVSSAGDTDASVPVRAPDESGRGELSDRITQAGLVLGTPRYMAPEQHEGGELTAAADQYALCVALWEALAGRGPFCGREGARSGLGLYTAKCEGPPAWPKGLAVPRAVARAVRRGLSPSPRQRWPTVDALLRELLRGKMQRRRRTTILLVGGGAVVAGGALWLETTAEQRRVAACQDAGAEIDDVWNDERREAARAGLIGTEAGNATTTADKLMPWLEDYAQGWRDARTGVCLQSSALEASGPELAERAVWCLEDRRLSLESLLAEFSEADLETVGSAVAAAAALPTIDSCRDPLVLQRLVMPPDSVSDEIHALRVALSRTDALLATGAYEEGLSAARDNLERAEAVGWAPLIAGARRRVGALLEQSGHFEDAADVLEQAYFEAVNSGAVEDAFSAARRLVRLTGQRLARFEEAERWYKHAEVLHNVLPDPAGLRQAGLAASLAIVRHANGQYADATVLFERALDLRTKALGPDHPDVADALDNLASARDVEGAVEQAAQLHERGLKIREAALGKDHPLVARSLHNLALVRIEVGDHEGAAAMQERAIRILEASVGPDHVDLATTLAGLGALRSKTGAYTEAAELYERAVSILQPAHGAAHPRVGNILIALAAAQLAATGDAAKAAAAYERAIEVFEAAYGPDHPGVANALLMKADLALSEGAAAEALPVAERALRLRTTQDVPPEELAHAKFSVARALADSGGSIDRARTLAQQALEGFASVAPRYPERRASIEEWLSAHAASP